MLNRGCGFTGSRALKPSKRLESELDSQIMDPLGPPLDLGHSKWSPLGSFSAPFGTHLGSIWTSWGSLGTLWGSLGTLWSSLGNIWGTFSALLGSFWWLKGLKGQLLKDFSSCWYSCRRLL